MFNGAGAFDQSLGDWTLNTSVNLNVIFNNSGLSCYNYSETLKGWSANPDTPDGLSLAADGRTYSPGAADARNNLIAKGWIIEGDAVSDTECLRLLPVTLVSFSGQKNSENQNVLKWTTADEIDFDRFEVQRSEDALSFEKIGDVYGKAEYVFTDRSPSLYNYYRLKMIDRAADRLDGSYEYSRIILIKNEAQLAVVGSFYPNPSSGKVRVDVNAPESGRWILTMVDISGKNIFIRAYDLQKGQNTITLEHLAEGIHLVRFEYGRFSEVRKLIRD